MHTNVLILSLDRLLDEQNTYGGSGPTQFFIEANGFEVALKVDTYVFTDLYSIIYKRIGNYVTTASSFPYPQINFDGDIFVTPMNIMDYTFTEDGSSNVTVGGSGVRFLTESTINAGMRHGDFVSANKYSYFKWSSLLSSLTSGKLAKAYANYIVQKYYEPSVTTPAAASFYPETYLYNRGYSNLTSLKAYYPLPYTYDFCAVCNFDEFPFRIYYSESDDQERRRDYYRTIYVNNYRDIDGTYGPITDLFCNFNEMIVTTPILPLIIPTNTQVLNTQSDETVFLGNGSVFQIPAKPLRNADSAFGGNLHWTSRCSTEYGTFWMDGYSGRPFILDDKLNDLGLKGLRNYFQTEGKLNFLEQFKAKTTLDYPIKTITSPIGVGYMSVYDPRYKRIILTKKDYAIVPQYVNNLSYATDGPSTTPNSIWFDGIHFYSNNEAGAPTTIDFSHSEFFENHSFTVSYSFLTNSWVSWHSYLPHYMFADHSTFYTNEIWKHSFGPFQSFYGIKYDHILDLIVTNNPVQAMINDSFSYTSDTWLYSPVTTSYERQDDTFDRAIIYNSKQTSGDLNITDYSNNLFETSIPAGTLPVRRTDNKWKANTVRDHIIDPSLPVWDSS